MLYLFQDGDDLRQDIIVIQLFGLMDQLWRDCNLDLKMITFLCLSTGLKQGKLSKVIILLPSVSHFNSSIL